MFVCKYHLLWFYRCHMFHAANRCKHLHIQCLICVCLFLIGSDCMSLVYIGNLIYLHNVLIVYYLKCDLTRMGIELRFFSFVKRILYFLLFLCLCVVYDGLVCGCVNGTRYEKWDNKWFFYIFFF